MIIGKFVAVAVVAYLLGAIPFAMVVSKLMAGIDISKHGSGNIGGTNVYRTLGTKAGAIVAVLDLAKASAAVLLARVIIGNDVLHVAGFPISWQWGQVLAALMVMVGHNWSVYIKFRGGKGVATYFGSWFAIYPPAALIGGIILILTVLRSRYMSLGSMLAAFGILCLFIILTVESNFPWIYLVYSVIAAALIFYQHRANISRLQSGTELRLDVPPKKT
jgi:glycerol-3-phosphate acyltransferase PlsY